MEANELLTADRKAAAAGRDSCGLSLLTRCIAPTGSERLRTAGLSIELLPNYTTDVVRQQMQTNLRFGRNRPDPVHVVPWRHEFIEVTLLEETPSPQPKPAHHPFRIRIITAIQALPFFLLT